MIVLLSEHESFEDVATGNNQLINKGFNKCLKVDSIEDKFTSLIIISFQQFVTVDFDLGIKLVNRCLLERLKLGIQFI